MISLIDNISSVFIAKSCLGCQQRLELFEKHLCTYCRHELPFTNYHTTDENPMKRTFQGRLDVEQATALFHFSKGSTVQELIHAIKYRGHTQLGVMLGDWLGHELKHIEGFSDIDLVIPVPLHPIRKMRRGYNQVDGFAKRLAFHLDRQFTKKHLLRKRFTKKMAFKGRLDRWTSLEQAFKVKGATALNGKHILLVDDVITTGATLEACAQALLTEAHVTISMACMAITD